MLTVGSRMLRRSRWPPGGLIGMLVGNLVWVRRSGCRNRVCGRWYSLGPLIDHRYIGQSSLQDHSGPNGHY